MWCARISYTPAVMSADIFLLFVLSFATYQSRLLSEHHWLVGQLRLHWDLYLAADCKALNQ
jgi:hypothetical protein